MGHCSAGCYGIDITPSPLNSQVNWLWVGTGVGTINVFSLYDPYDPKILFTIHPWRTVFNKYLTPVFKESEIMIRYTKYFFKSCFHGLRYVFSFLIRTTFFKTVYQR